MNSPVDQVCKLLKFSNHIDVDCLWVSVNLFFIVLGSVDLFAESGM